MRALKGLSILWGICAMLNLIANELTGAIVCSALSIFAGVTILVRLHDEHYDPS